MSAKRVFNTIFFAIAVYVLYLKAPGILTNFKFQDQKAPAFSIVTMKNEPITINALSKKLVIIFWATWCGPCEIELKRVNEMVMERKILPSDVLAISIQEAPNTVLEAIKKRNYLFDVAIDADGSIARKFEITSTPTVVFLDKDQTVHWMSAGMSPTLEFRISSFIRP